MAKNDVVLLDALLKKIATDGTDDIGEKFDRFVIEQVLKNYDLSRDELEFGLTDGSLDGGVDGFYIFINGLLLTDPTDTDWPKSKPEIRVFLFTCKHKDTFFQQPLDLLLSTAQELFDLSVDTGDLVGKYSSKIKSCRDLFITAYQELSLSRPTLMFDVIYASRGDVQKLGESVAATAARIVELLNSYFSASSSKFVALGSTELIELHREVKSFALSLPVQECLAAGQEGYLVLAKLSDYSAFVCDERGGAKTLFV